MKLAPWLASVRRKTPLIGNELRTSILLLLKGQLKCSDSSTIILAKSQGKVAKIKPRLFATCCSIRREIDLHRSCFRTCEIFLLVLNKLAPKRHSIAHSTSCEICSWSRTRSQVKVMLFMQRELFSSRHKWCTCTFCVRSEQGWPAKRSHPAARRHLARQKEKRKIEKRGIGLSCAREICWLYSIERERSASEWVLLFHWPRPRAQAARRIFYCFSSLFPFCACLCSLARSPRAPRPRFPSCACTCSHKNHCWKS